MPYDTVVVTDFAVLGGAFIMFRMWGKIIKDNHLVKDTTICISDYSLSRTQMVFQSLDDICYEFDLSKPIWLDSNIHDFQLHAKTITFSNYSIFFFLGKVLSTTSTNIIACLYCSIA